MLTFDFKYLIYSYRAYKFFISIRNYQPLFRYTRKALGAPPKPFLNSRSHDPHMTYSLHTSCMINRRVPQLIAHFTQLPKAKFTYKIEKIKPISVISDLIIVISKIPRTPEFPKHPPKLIIFWWVAGQGNLLIRLMTTIEHFQRDSPVRITVRACRRTE